MTGVAPAMVWRVRLAAAFAAVLAVAVTLEAALGSGAFLDSPVALLLAAVGGFLLGAWTPVRLAMAWVLLLTIALTYANQRLFPGEYPLADDAVFFLMTVGAPAVLGVAVVARTRQVRQLTELSAQLRSRRAADVEAARLEERERIELAVHHRLVEHMGAIAIRADGDRQSTDTDARPTLAQLETLARSGLQELREALGLLREDGREDPSAVAEPSAPPEPNFVPRDLVLTAVLGAGLAVEAVLGEASRGLAPANVLGALVSVAPLAVRRRHPLVAVSSTVLLAAAMTSLLTPWSQLVMGIAVLLALAYTVGSRTRGWRRILGVGVLATGILLIVVASPPVARPDLASVLPTVTWVGLAVIAGVVVAGGTERVGRLHRVASELERTRDAEVRIATARQRQLMARDLHDSVAHTLTAICLNAAVARQQGGSDAEALSTIATVARRGMVELRSGLNSLVETDRLLDPHALALLAHALGVDLRVEVPDDLALDGSSVELLHRLLRESIVNAARHAPGASMRARFHRHKDGVELEVSDDGPGRSTSTMGTGSGLVGLADQFRERGGRLSYGPLPGRGFGLNATLPA